MAGVVVALLAALSFASATVWLRAASVDVDATAGVIVRMPVILPVFGSQRWCGPGLACDAWTSDCEA